jgi:hypothetical protein
MGTDTQAPGPPDTSPIPFQSGAPLTEQNFSLVSDFTCNPPGRPENRYEEDVSRWIKDTGRGGALEASRLGLAEVRLYLTPDGRLIGFAAIGPDTWRLSDGTDLPVCLLHYFAVHTAFRNQPADVPREASYGRRILRGLIQEVEQRGNAAFFALYVDPANPAGRLYAELGWKELDVLRGPTWVSASGFAW